MADKQIGIKLDVRQTGLQQVDDALDTISKNLAGMNESVIKQQKQGWGSESQTKELREQLRYMQQMTQLYERIARTQGRDSSSFGNFKSEIGKMQGDLGSLPSYRTGAVGGYVHQKFGENAAAGLDKVVSAIGKLGAMYAGFSVASTLHSGFQRGDQLMYGYGDIARRMGVRGSAIKYGRDMTLGLDGYGYDDTSVMQATQSYSTATGRMNPNDLKSQMQSILSTGRRFGMDLGQTAQTFGDAFQSGVTGGSQAQMNPQQFATLVANATVQAHMQGKEAQMLSQLTQVTQMSMQSNGTAGSEKTIASLLAMGNKTGNQALIGNLPNMIGSIDQGISNPSGGYASQALMMRAIGGGKMNFWDEQYLQSKGAFGRETDANGQEIGQTNIEKATNYLMKTFKGNKNRQYMMLGQMFNLKPAQAKQYIDAYTKNGQFDSDTLNQIQSGLGSTAPSVTSSDSDIARAKDQSVSTGADANAGGGTTGIRSDIKGLWGDLLKSPVGTGIGGAAMGLGIGAGALKFGKPLISLLNLKKLIGGAKNVGGSAISEVAATAESIPSILGSDGKPLAPSSSSIASNVAKTASKGGGFFKSIGKFLGPVGEVMMADQAANWGDQLGDWTFGHKEGSVKSNGLFDNPFKMKKWADSRDPIWKRMFNSKPSDQFSTPQGPPDPANTSSATSSAQGLVPIVVSTLIALQPYMGQIKGVLGVDPSARTASMSTDALRNPSIQNAPLTSGSSAGIRLASFNPSVKRVGAGSSSATSYSGGGSQGDFIQQMLPYAQQASAQTGLPVDYILGQWGHESGWGTSDAAKKNNNFAGIKPWGNVSAGANKTYAGYSSLNDFASGYANFYNQNDRYKGLLDAAKNGASSDELAKILGTTGYAEDKNYVGKLQGSIHSVDGYTHPAIPNDSLKTASLNGGNLKVDGGSITVHIKNDNGTTQTAKAPITAQYTGLKYA